MDTGMGSFSLLHSVDSSESISSLKSSSSKGSLNSRSLRPFKVSSPRSARKRARLLPRAYKRGGKNKPIVVRDSTSGGIPALEPPRSPRNKCHEHVTATDENHPPSLPNSQSGPAETLDELRRVLANLVNKDCATRKKRSKNAPREKKRSADAHSGQELPGHFNAPVFHAHPALDASMASDVIFDTPSPSPGRKKCHATAGSVETDPSSPRLVTSSGSVLSLDKVDFKAKPTEASPGKDVVLDAEEGSSASKRSEPCIARADEPCDREFSKPPQTPLRKGPKARVAREKSHRAGPAQPSEPGACKVQPESLQKKRLRHREKTPQQAHCSAFDGPTAPHGLGVEAQHAKPDDYRLATGQDVEAGGVTSSDDVTIPGGLEPDDYFETQPSLGFDPMVAVTFLMDLVSSSLRFVWEMAQGT